MWSRVEDAHRGRASLRATSHGSTGPRGAAPMMHTPLPYYHLGLGSRMLHSINGIIILLYYIYNIIYI